MSELLDTRPGGLDLLFRAGDPLTVVITWQPSGVLAGRTFTATLGAATLGLVVFGDAIVLTATPAQTTAAAPGQTFKLTDTTPADDVTLLVGRWSASPRAALEHDTTVTVAAASATATVEVATSAPPSQGVVRRWAQPVAAKGAVCFIWDDGLETAPQVAAINQARGQQVTFAITTGLIGVDPNCMTVDQVQDLHAAGHEIAAHGVQHATGLPALTAAQRATEYTDCLAWFEANGITRPSTWVYTFGGGVGRSDDTDRELMGRVDRVFDANGPTEAFTAVRRDRPQFVMGRYQLEALGAQARGNGERLIRMAAQQPVVVSFYLHWLDAVGASLTTAEYTAFCDLCVALDVPVITARDAFPASASLLVDGGFELPAQVWTYAVGPNGSTVAAVTDTPVVGLPGTKSLQLHGVEAGFSFAMAYQHVPVRPTEAYTLSGRYRTTAGAGGLTVSTRGRSVDYKGVDSGAITATALPETTTWTRFTHDYTATPSATAMRFDLLVQPAVGVGQADAWFDHLCLMPKQAGAYG